jgi:GGDEF domain-containing protein
MNTLRPRPQLAAARRLDVPATALFMDIDGFKQINDRYGRRAGDEVLRQVGARLKTVLREDDTVGRLGGDEFVMLVDSVGLDAAPERRGGRGLQPGPRAARRGGDLAQSFLFARPLAPDVLERFLQESPGTAGAAGAAADKLPTHAT